VLALQPDRVEARTGVDRVVNALEARLVRALQARNAPEGAIALTALQRAQPDHPRLEALHAQLLSISRSMKPVLTATPGAPPTSSPSVASSASGATAMQRQPTEQSRAIAKAGGKGAAESTATADSTKSQPAAPSMPSAEELAAVAMLRERGALIEPAGGNAYDEFIALRKRFPDSAEIRAEQQRLAFALLENTRTALAAGNVGAAAAFVTRAEIVVPGMATTKALRDQLAEASRQRDFMKNVVPAATLKRQHEVAPVYPREAQRNGIEGWVDVEFTIASDGATQDLVVRASQPRDVFEKSALDSVSRWRFNPVVRDGVPVAQRAYLRVKFVLQ
jgi:TonB family protein